jgi:DUF1707 SHOCT-like domain
MSSTEHKPVGVLVAQTTFYTDKKNVVIRVTALPEWGQVNRCWEIAVLGGPTDGTTRTCTLKSLELEYELLKATTRKAIVKEGMYIHTERSEEVNVNHPIERVDERIGDKQRNAASASLSNAFEAGYLDLSEFDERTAAVNYAKTWQDILDALKDLPVQYQQNPANEYREKVTEQGHVKAKRDVAAGWFTVGGLGLVLSVIAGICSGNIGILGVIAAFSLLTLAIGVITSL